MAQPPTPNGSPAVRQTTANASLQRFKIYAGFGCLAFVILMISALIFLTGYDVFPTKQQCAIAGFLTVLVSICLAVGGAFIGGNANVNLDMQILGLDAGRMIATIGGSFVFFIVGYILMQSLPLSNQDCSSRTGYLHFELNKGSVDVQPSQKYWLSNSKDGNSTTIDIRMRTKRITGGASPEGGAINPTIINFSWTGPAADVTKADQADTKVTADCIMRLFHNADVNKIPGHNSKTATAQSSNMDAQTSFVLNPSGKGCDGFFRIASARDGIVMMDYAHFPIEGEKIAIFEDNCATGLPIRECIEEPEAQNIISESTSFDKSRGGFWPFSAAYAEGVFDFSGALTNLDSEFREVRGVTRREIGAQFSDPMIANQTVSALANPENTANVKEGLLHALIAGIEVSDQKWNPNNDPDLSDPLPFVGSSEIELTFQLLADEDADVRKQARRLVQRYPVDDFQDKLNETVTAAVGGDCNATYGSGELVYATIFYRYNRFIRKALDNPNTIDFNEWEQQEKETIAAAQACLTESSAIDSAVMIYGRALGEAWSSDVEQQERGKQTARKFLEVLGDNRDNYYKQRHVAQMLRLAELQIDENGQLVPQD